MTTIAWDGTTLAADSQSTAGSMICSLNEKKIICPSHGESWSVGSVRVLAVGMSGDCGVEEEFIDALKAGLTYKTELLEMSSFTAIIVTGKNACFLVFKDEGKKHAKICSHGGSYAVGSGGDIARAAMALGKTAQEAVHLACELDVYSGGDVITFNV